MATPQQPPVDPVALADSHTTRCGGSFGGNSQLTEHVIDRDTERTLCGKDAKIKGYGSGWTAKFDGMPVYLGTDKDMSGGVCQRCAASARTRGFVNTDYETFQPTKVAK